jgi:LPXTG-motif cell wall-anchored protein
MRNLILAILLICPIAVFGWQAASTPTGGVRIVSPRPGDKLVNDFVDVRYEVAAAVSASGSPTFRVRLDGRDPVTTTDLSYTFTNLTAGAHTVTVEVVDANGTPISGSVAQIQFSVVTGQNAPNRLPRPRSSIKNAREYRQVAMQSADQREELPQTGSALPLLSVIGLGVLIGGLASALKVTRSGG